MMMNLALRHHPGLPGKRSWPRNVEDVRLNEQVGDFVVIERIAQPHATDDDRVPIIIGSERSGGHAPHTLIVLLHREGLGSAFDIDGNFFVVGTTETKSYAFIGVHLGRDQWRRWWRWILR